MEGRQERDQGPENEIRVSYKTDVLRAVERAVAAFEKFDTVKFSAINSGISKLILIVEITKIKSEGLHQLNVFPIIHIAGIGYNNFRGIGKKVNLIITQFLFDQKIESAHDRVAFNNHVCKVLNENILVPTQKTVIHKNFWYFFHKPYFRLIHRIVDKKTKGTVFYDSVLFALLFFSYPIFLLLLFIILSQFNISTVTILIILIAIPLLSKSTIS